MSLTASLLLLAAPPQVPPALVPFVRGMERAGGNYEYCMRRSVDGELRARMADGRFDSRSKEDPVKLTDEVMAVAVDRCRDGRDEVVKAATDYFRARDSKLSPPREDAFYRAQIDRLVAAAEEDVRDFALPIFRTFYTGPLDAPHR